MFAVKVKDWRILGISKNEASKITKAEPPPMSVAMKTNVASDAIEVVDDRMVPGSRKDNGNKRDHKKET